VMSNNSGEFTGKCPRCNAPCDENHQYCAYCGAPVPGAKIDEVKKPEAKLPEGYVMAPRTGLVYEHYRGNFIVAAFVNKWRRYLAYQKFHEQQEAINNAILEEHKRNVILKAKMDAITDKYSDPAASQHPVLRFGKALAGFGQAWQNYGNRIHEREEAFKKKKAEEDARRKKTR